MGHPAFALVRAHTPTLLTRWPLATCKRSIHIRQHIAHNSQHADVLAEVPKIDLVEAICLRMVPVEVVLSCRMRTQARHTLGNNRADIRSTTTWRNRIRTDRLQE